MGLVLVGADSGERLDMGAYYGVQQIKVDWIKAAALYISTVNKNGMYNSLIALLNGSYSTVEVGGVFTYQRPLYNIFSTINIVDLLSLDLAGLYNWVMHCDNSGVLQPEQSIRMVEFMKKTKKQLKVISPTSFDGDIYDMLPFFEIIVANYEIVEFR